jgi:arginase
MIGVRADDLLEREQIDRSGIKIIPVSEVKSPSDRLGTAVEQLGSNVGAIYVHLDIDVLDPSELANLRLAEPGGPSRLEMANALMLVMQHPKVNAFGVSDINPRKDVDGQIIGSALAVAEGGVKGLLRRQA